MKYRVKQINENQDSPIVGILFTIGFFAFGLFGLYFSLSPWIESMTLDVFMKTFSKNGLLTLVSLVFFVLSIIFILYLIKPAKRCIASLDSLHNEDIDGNNVYVYEFSINDGTKAVYNSYKCYSKERIPINVGSNYIIGVKEFNWEIKYVIDKLQDNYVIKDSKEYNPMNIILYIFYFIFGGGLIFTIIYTIYDYNRGKKITADLVGVVILLVIVGYITYFYKVANSKIKTTEDLLLEEEQRQIKLMNKQK